MAPLLIPIGMSLAGGAAITGTTALAIGATAVGTGIGVAGAIQQGQAAETQAKSAQNIADFNARVQEQEAAARRQKAAFESKRQAKAAARTKSALTAKIAAAGGLGSPVAEDLAAEQAKELELENLLIGFEGEVAARRSLSQASIDRVSGKVFRRKGKSLKTTSQFSAGQTLLTGFGSTV